MPLWQIKLYEGNYSQDGMLNLPSSSSHDEEDELARTAQPRVIRGTESSSEGGEDNSSKQPSLHPSQFSMCKVMII